MAKSDTDERTAHEQLLRYLADRQDMLLRGITSNTGAEFLHWLVCCLQETLGVECAFVGELWGQNWQRVRTLVKGKHDPGTYTVKWNGEDDDGWQTSAGVYLYKMKAGSFSGSGKMTLLP